MMAIVNYKPIKNLVINGTEKIAIPMMTVLYMSAKQELPKGFLVIDDQEHLCKKYPKFAEFLKKHKTIKKQAKVFNLLSIFES